jgi:hypothetical protein
MHNRSVIIAQSSKSTYRFEYPQKLRPFYQNIEKSISVHRGFSHAPAYYPNTSLSISSIWQSQYSASNTKIDQSRLPVSGSRSIFQRANSTFFISAFGGQTAPGFPANRRTIRRLSQLSKKSIFASFQYIDRKKHLAPSLPKKLTSTGSFFGHQSQVSNKFFGGRSRNLPIPFLRPTTALVNQSAGRFPAVWNSGQTSPSVSSRVDLLSYRSGVPVHLTRIPALSLARYAFDREAVLLQKANEAHTIGILHRTETKHPRPTSAGFLRHLTREIEGRYQYVAVQIPDLIRISFLGRYLKKAQLLAHVYARALIALPRARKETQFLRFLTKVVKVFSAQRKEMLGVRIRFKGRVNRWRRTKQVVGEKGTLPLYTYNARIERGDSQAITRKGTRGVRLWLAYDSSFTQGLQRTLISYVRVFSSRTS